MRNTSLDQYYKQKWDNYSVLSYKREQLYNELFAKGFAEGFAEGFEERKKKIARDLKMMDVPPNKIAFYTDLSIKEVADLKSS